MLRQDAPGEWQDHREEFIERPKADELGIIEMRRDRATYADIGIRAIMP